MISRRIFAAVALLCAITAPAYAQKTKASLNTEIGVQFPDNTTFLITPSNLRTVTGDIVNSIMPTAPVVSGNLACFSGTTGLLQDCGSAPSGFIASITGDCTAGSNGVITCTKTNGSAFVASATTDTTNASNIASGTLNTLRLPSPFTSGTASGNTTKFATASGSLTNGNCAKFDGSGNIVDNGSACGTSGQYILLNTLTCPNISTTGCGDTTSLTATYSVYEIVFENLLPATSAVSCELQVHSGGTFQSTGYQTVSVGAPGGGTVTVTAPSTYIPCNTTAGVSNAAPGMTGFYRVSTPSTSNIHIWQAQFSYWNGTNAATTTSSGFWNSSAVIDGFQVLFSTGNITSGTIKIYGIQ